MDGNFEAEHMKMRNPENDVPLSEGTGFMVSRKPYELHLQSAIERQQHGGHLESTGIDVTACIHGAFVPDSVVDFQKGEVALNFNMEGIQAALISYNVMCQWSVHMMDRVNGSTYLKLPDNLKLKLVIGLFHIHGHQDTCLARYSPSFIKGGWQIDIETIETLWAPLNEITRSTRGMSTSHRQEVIDDHMNDSNWKKLVDLVPKKKMLRGCDIFSIPSHAEILLELTEKEIGTSGRERHATWISTGLKIQEMQVSLQALVRKIGSHSTPDQQREVMVKWAQLQERVDTFHKQAANILQAVSEGGADLPVVESYVGAEFNGIGKEDDDNEHSSSAEDHDQTHLSGNSAANGCVDAEYISLHLPSHFRCDWCNKNAAEDLAKAELCLREGQLNDSLHHIRMALGYKSYLFRHDVCPARTQKLKTHAWEGVHAVESTVQLHTHVYTHVQQAMVDLGASDNLLEWYKILRWQHLSVKTSVIVPQVRGPQNARLSWYWSMDVRQDTDVEEWMEDCT
ncbi:hypothetical protein EI94DRAFT_1702128 [Lactarius quietus]|nr:hypothetical protein EI94DRAFT_1702128 [Lactarius quietus]